MEMENITEAPAKQIIPPISVGEEFIGWAEKFWALERCYSDIAEEKRESCPYPAIREIFVKKINDILLDRLNWMTVK
jgi:hypothetical protein